LHQHIGKLVSHPREKSGLQFLQGKAELLAKFVHDEKPLPVVFLADTTRSEDRLLVPSFSSPAPRALPPGAFTARATRPFNSYPHDPPQSGNAPVLLTHLRGPSQAPAGPVTAPAGRRRSRRSGAPATPRGGPSTPPAARRRRARPRGRPLPQRSPAGAPRRAPGQTGRRSPSAPRRPGRPGAPPG